MGRGVCMRCRIFFRERREGEKGREEKRREKRREEREKTREEEGEEGRRIRGGGRRRRRREEKRPEVNKQRQRGSWAGLFPDAPKSGAFLSLSNTFTASVASPKPSVSLTHKTAPFFPPNPPPGTFNSLYLQNCSFSPILLCLLQNLSRWQDQLLLALSRSLCSGQE